MLHVWLTLECVSAPECRIVLITTSARVYVGGKGGEGGGTCFPLCVFASVIWNYRRDLGNRPAGHGRINNGRRSRMLNSFHLHFLYVRLSFLVTAAATLQCNSRWLLPFRVLAPGDNETPAGPVLHGCGSFREARSPF